MKRRVCEIVGEGQKDVAVLSFLLHVLHDLRARNARLLHDFAFKGRCGNSDGCDHTRYKAADEVEEPIVGGEPTLENELRFEYECALVCPFDEHYHHHLITYYNIIHILLQTL